MHLIGDEVEWRRLVPSIPLPRWSCNHPTCQIASEPCAVQLTFEAEMRSNVKGHETREPGKPASREVERAENQHCPFRASLKSAEPAVPTTPWPPRSRGLRGLHWPAFARRPTRAERAGVSHRDSLVPLAESLQCRLGIHGYSRLRSPRAHVCDNLAGFERAGQFQRFQCSKGPYKVRRRIA
jgi:hypothetical protein